jgi:hypothetical protein
MPSPLVGAGIAAAVATSLVLDALLIWCAWRAVSREKPQLGAAGTGGRANAAPPVMHHQQYALRPRQRWPLAARLLLWGSLLFLGGGLVLAIVLPRLVRSAQAVVKESPSNNFADSPGERRFRYYVSAPPGHKVTFWVEVWKDGALRTLPGFSHTQWIIPAKDWAFEGYVELAMQDAEAADREGQSRWTWKINSRQGNSTTGGFVPDPLLGMTVQDSSWTGDGNWSVVPGRSYPLLVLRGDKERLEGKAGDPNIVRDADTEVTLKIRIDPVRPEEQREGPQYGSSRRPPDHTEEPGVGAGLPDPVPVPAHEDDHVVPPHASPSTPVDPPATGPPAVDPRRPQGDGPDAGDASDRKLLKVEPHTDQ